MAAAPRVYDLVPAGAERAGGRGAKRRRQQDACCRQTGRLSLVCSPPHIMLHTDLLTSALLLHGEACCRMRRFRRRRGAGS